jgi:hypothetical protein
MSQFCEVFFLPQRRKDAKFAKNYIVDIEFFMSSRHKSVFLIVLHFVIPQLDLNF